MRTIALTFICLLATSALFAQERDRKKDEQPRTEKNSDKYQSAPMDTARTQGTTGSQGTAGTQKKQKASPQYRNKTKKELREQTEKEQQQERRRKAERDSTIQVPKQSGLRQTN